MQEPDPYTGLYPGSNGGTELTYREIKKRIPSELFDKVQLIASRPNRLLNKPRILHLHDHATDPPKGYSDKGFRNLFSKHVFVSNTQLLMFRLLTGIDYSEAVVIKNAINPILDWDNKPTDRINMIYHTTPHRGLEILIPVFVKLVEANPNINLNLDVYSSFKAYGWDKNDEPYHKIFDICRNHPNITYHGFQPNEIIREALKTSHIFAYPNIWPETYCLAAVEAMSAGCIVICPNHEGLYETVGHNGVTYDYTEDMKEHANKFAMITNSVIKNYHNSSSLKNLTYQCSKYVNTFHDWDFRIHSWINLFEEVVEKHGKKAS